MGSNDQMKLIRELIGITKDTLQDVLPKELLEDMEPVFEFRMSLNDESDRGCVLMAASFLNDRLGRLLKTFLVDKPKTTNKLFEAYSPLSTFCARIDMAYCLGLISEQVWKDLHLIRKIRNDFGHTAKYMDFGHKEVTARCRELVCSFMGQEEAARKRFINACFGILAEVNGRTHLVEHRQVATTKLFEDEQKQKVKKFIEAVQDGLAEASE